MKRILSLILTAVMLLALAACSSPAPTPEPSGEPMAGMPNPWSEYEKPDEAAEAAGVGTFELPEDHLKTAAGQLDWQVYRALKGMAEAIAYVGPAELRIRKGVRDNGDDISGDYTEYTYDWTMDVGGTEILCRGSEKGKTSTATWVTDNFAYSIHARSKEDPEKTIGLDADVIETLVNAVQ